MKKIFIFSLIIIFIFAAIAFIQINTEKKATQSSNDLYKNQISTEELDLEIKSEKSTYVYFYQEDCLYCKKVSPILIPMADELNVDLKVHSLQKNPDNWGKYQIEGTPTLVHFKNDKEVDRIKGANEEKVYREWFDAQNIKN